MTSKMLGLLMATGMLLGACATVSRQAAQTRPRQQRVQGEVVLADGKAVVDMGVELRCGEQSLRTRTDANGRFLLRDVNMGPGCRAWLHRGENRHQRAQWSVQQTQNVLRAKSPLRLEVTPFHRLQVELVGPKGERVALLLDEARDDPRARKPWAGREALTHRHPRLGRLSFRLGNKKGRLALRSVGALPKGWRLARAEMTPLATLPAVLRAPPRAHDRLHLQLLGRGKARRLEKLVGERTVIWVGACAQLKTALERDLVGLEASRGVWGLRTLVILTDGCGESVPSAKGSGARIYWGGQAAKWAFGAKASTLLVMAADGALPWRRVVADQLSGVERAITFLRRSWPVFAAAERVSVESSVTVPRATVTRLLAQADVMARRGETKAATALFDRVLRLSPGHAEAHRRRALIKAALGDLGGAMSDVSWWRDTYGDDSADELLDQVQRSSPAGASLR